MGTQHYRPYGLEVETQVRLPDPAQVGKSPAHQEQSSGEPRETAPKLEGSTSSWNSTPVRRRSGPGANCE